jgi:hypothetical protein
VSNKQISKVIVYYTDGSFEELTKTYSTPGPISMFNNRCMVCGGDHGVNMQCPNLSPNTIWKSWEAGQEDPGK